MNPPILLFGLPRSGTTWLGKIFDSHPKSLYRHEPDSVLRLTMPLFPDKVDAASYTGEILELMAALPLMRECKVVGKTPIFSKTYLSAPALLMKHASIWTAKILSRVNGNFPVLFLPKAEYTGRVRIVWKSIESLGRLGALLSILESAVAIHLLRHPCGYIASVLRGESARTFTDNRPSSDDYALLRMLLHTKTAQKYAITLEQLRGLTPEERLAWRWVLVNEKAIDDTKQSGRAMLISYDALCCEPETVTKRMFEFTGLSWNGQTERFLQQSTTANRTGYYSVFKDPLRVATRWQEELASPVIERVMRVVSKSSFGTSYFAGDGLALGQWRGGCSADD